MTDSLSCSLAAQVAARLQCRWADGGITNAQQKPIQRIRRRTNVTSPSVLMALFFLNRASWLLPCLFPPVSVFCECLGSKKQFCPEEASPELSKHHIGRGSLLLPCMKQSLWIYYPSIKRTRNEAIIWIHSFQQQGGGVTVWGLWRAVHHCKCCQRAKYVKTKARKVDVFVSSCTFTELVQ